TKDLLFTIKKQILRFAQDDKQAPTLQVWLSWLERRLGTSLARSSALAAAWSHDASRPRPTHPRHHHKLPVDRTGFAPNDSAGDASNCGGAGRTDAGRRRRDL